MSETRRKKRICFNWSLLTPRIGYGLRTIERIGHGENLFGKEYIYSDLSFLFNNGGNPVVSDVHEFGNTSVSTSCAVIHLLTKTKPQRNRYLLYGSGWIDQENLDERKSNYKFCYEIGCGQNIIPEEMKSIINKCRSDKDCWKRVIDGRITYIRINETRIFLKPVIFYNEAVKLKMVTPKYLRGERYISDTHYEPLIITHENFKRNLRSLYSPGKVHIIAGDVTDLGCLSYIVGFIFCSLDSGVNLNYIQPLPGNHDLNESCGLGKASPVNLQMFKFFFLGKIVNDCDLYSRRSYDIFRIPIGKKRTLLYVVTIKYSFGVSEATCNVSLLKEKLIYEYENDYEVVISMHHGPVRGGGLVCWKTFQRLMNEYFVQKCVKMLHFGHTHEFDETISFGVISLRNSDKFSDYNKDILDRMINVNSR